MKSRISRIAVVFILITGVAVSLGAAPLSLDELIDKTGASLEWDPHRQIGRLQGTRGSLVFRPGLPWMVADYEQVLPASISEGSRGELLFSEDTARKVLEQLGEKGDNPRIQWIILDPGHGGRDPGAISTHRLEKSFLKIEEKEVVLDVALQVQDLLAQGFPDKKILLTREDDRYRTLEERTEMANDLELEPGEAMIFVSIHANASLTPVASGFEVWYLPADIDRTVIEEDELGDVDPDIIPILNDMLDYEYTRESVRMAQFLLDGLQATVGGQSPNRGMKEESWFVVRNARMPSVLIELGFLTNKGEAVLLNSGEYLKKLSLGIYNGLAAFIREYESTKAYTE